jgi:hypothetical protein
MSMRAKMPLNNIQNMSNRKKQETRLEMVASASCICQVDATTYGPRDLECGQ